MEPVSFRAYRGGYALIGDALDSIGSRLSTNVPADAVANRLTRDSHCHDSSDTYCAYHITVISSSEYKQCISTVANSNTEQLDNSHNLQSVVDSLVMRFPLTFHCIGKLFMEKKNSNQSQQCWYAFIYCKFAEELRQQLGLPPKVLHITLGYRGSDLHCEVSSPYDCISEWETTLKLVAIADNVMVVSDSISKDKLDISVGEFEFLTRFVHRVIDTNNKIDQSIAKCLIRIGKFMIDRQNLINTIDGINLTVTIGDYLFRQGYLFGIRLLITMNKYKQNCINMDYVKSLLPTMYNRISSENNNKEKVLDRESFVLRGVNLSLEYNCNDQKYSQVITVASLNDYTSPYFQIRELPRNFSWISLTSNSLERGTKNCDSTNIMDHLLCGSAYPKPENLIALHGVGVRNIFTLHEDVPFKLQKPASDLGIKLYHYHIIDRRPTTIATTLEICKLIDSAIDKQEGVLIHCQGGVGRTNTIIISYLMMKNFINAATGIEEVSAQRKLILHDSQREFLVKWFQYLSENNLFQSTYQSSKSEAMGCKITTMESIKEVNLDSHTSETEEKRMYESLSLPPLILLCGLAASGKSTFSKTLLSSYPNHFVRINKDEMRGKGQCDNALYDGLRKFSNSNGKHTGTVLVDCCNLTVEKRKEWIQTAHNTSTWCIFFNILFEECQHRIEHRANHPTIPSGKAGLTVLRSMIKLLQPPTTSEKFDKLIVLNTEEVNTCLEVDFKANMNYATAEIKATVSASAMNDELLKFPRTSHLINFGAATRDDKISTASDIDTIIKLSNSSSVSKVIVEEKIDGANMGISISSEGQIVVQNRSHYITSQYHAQFGPLSKWIAKNSDDLWSILEPSRTILYGEWVYATHSVKYNSLPDWFIAYDLYDRIEKKFASRKVLEEKLAGTNLHLVPLIYQGPIRDVDHLKQLVYGPSAFIDSSADPSKDLFQTGNNSNQKSKSVKGDGSNRGNIISNRREGIVVRLLDEKNEWLVSRAKIVRPDFIAGNDRWNHSSKLELNELSQTVIHGESGY